MQTPYIDIHTHHHYSMRDATVLSVRNIAMNNQEAIGYDNCSLGLHPWYINADTKELVKLMRTEVNRSNILAVGECGIDKHIGVPLDEQVLFFEQQIQLAKEFHKPLIIHCVRAFQEVVQKLSMAQFQFPVIFHGYRKNWILAKQLVDKGYYLSVGHHCLDGNQDELLKVIPLSNLFLETDTHLEVEIAALYRYVARVRSIAMEELKQTIYHNYNTVFDK